MCEHPYSKPSCIALLGFTVLSRAFIPQLGWFKDLQLDLQLEPQPNPNLNFNLTELGFKLGSDV